MPDGWINDHAGDEVRPRPGFENELEARLRAAWHGKEAPSVRPITSPPQHGIRWRIAGALGVAAALVTAVAIAVVVRDDSSSPADPTGALPSPVPTAAPTTSPAPTTERGSTTPTTEAPPDATITPVASALPDAGGFVPACRETTGLMTPASADVGTIAAFGPLPMSPALTVALPASVAPKGQTADSNRVQSPSTHAVAVPGGVLAAIGASSAGSFPGTVLAVVNMDGTVRWVRCLDAHVSRNGLVTPPVGIDTRSALIGATTYDDRGVGTTVWSIVSLVDGSTIGTLPDTLSQGGQDLEGTDNATMRLDVRDTAALFGPAPDTAVDVETQRLLFVDVATLEGATIPLPDAANDLPWNQQRYVLDDHGDVALLAPYGSSTVLAVYVNGAWTTSTAARAASLASIGFDPSVPFGPLRAVDGSGADIWTAPEITDPTDEGFRASSSGDVTVVRACFDAASERPDCPQRNIAGVRNSDGEIVWRLDGVRAVGPVGDGYALVTEPETTRPDGTTTPGAWVMIDTDTGEPLPGQRWEDPTTFESQCCGGGEFVHVSRQGGIVIAVYERRLTVWYPESAGLSPATATLP